MGDYGGKTVTRNGRGQTSCISVSYEEDGRVGFDAQANEGAGTRKGYAEGRTCMVQIALFRRAQKVQNVA